MTNDPPMTHQGRTKGRMTNAGRAPTWFRRRLLGVCAAFVIGGSLVGHSSFAQPPGRPPLDQLFKRLDANKDGKLSREEFGKLAEIAPRLKGNPQAADRLCNQLDADGDGSLTLDEFKKLAELLPRPGAAKGAPKKVE